MKQLEERLRRSSTPLPRRPLSADFTARIVGGLEGKPRAPKQRPKWKEYIQMKLHKPAIVAASVLAVFAIGGTAYAAVGGISNIRAFFSGQTATRDGGRVIQIGTNACPRVDAFNITDKHRTDSRSYYVRVKPASTLTNQQVVSIIQGVCEADAEGTLNSAAMQQVEIHIADKDTLIGGYADSVITALGNSSITLRSDVPYASKNGSVVRTVTQTYRHIDPQAQVVDAGKIESLSTLHVGDHVSITYQPIDPSSDHSETLGPDKLDADTVRIVAVTRLSQAMQDYFNYSKYQAHDFEQVVPCSYSASGYCNLEEYLKNKQ
ncbi:MAG TPA: hypothetical protein VLF59_04250 [Candidatus Saccharimonadales bacterium]|nr:hypothetical protein [Candidatus Saccharimonadales bacterium]